MRIWYLSPSYQPIREAVIKSGDLGLSNSAGKQSHILDLCKSSYCLGFPFVMLRSLRMFVFNLRMLQSESDTEGPYTNQLEKLLLNLEIWVYLVVH